MTKKYIVTILLFITIGMFSGCGISENQEIGNSNNQQNFTQNITQNTEQNVTQNAAQNPPPEQNNSQVQQNNTQAQVAVRLEKATALALSRVSGATENDIQIELDYDDGYYVYEGEILYGQKEYEFEIDANTGTFLEWSEEKR